MLAAIALLFVLPVLASSGEGNIHLLEDEVADALRSCLYNGSAVSKRSHGHKRQSRSNYYDYENRVENRTLDTMKLFGHQKRNSSEQTYDLNGNEDNSIYDRTDTSVKYVRPAKFPSVNAYKNSPSNLVRRTRNSLLNKSDKDQCLSQCVFANLQVVDERGIPRESEFWNKLQIALTSQQSRVLLKDQVRACFQELQSEDDDNGCSYSNKLERCLVLRFSDRKINKTS